MNWTVTYNGSMPMQDLQLDPDGAKPDLTEQSTACSKLIRKQKHNHTVYTISLNTDSLEGAPESSEGRPLYQPIGRIVHILRHFEKGVTKKTHLVTYVVTEEGSSYGAPNAKYRCHTFKCKSEADADAIVFAAVRTMLAHAKRKRPDNILQATQEAKETAVQWWNASVTPLYHYGLGKDGLISGNINVFCQVDATLKTAKKVVRLDTIIKGDDLVNRLAEKFNLGDINPEEYAVFAIMQTSEADQRMLDDDSNPVVESLKWRDPFEGSFWLRKLPQGLVRVNKRDSQRPSVVSNSQGQTVQPTPVPEPEPEPEPQSPTQLQTHDALSPRRSEPTSESPLGPLLPFHQDDEDLLLNVMIKRQTGVGLGFKLTPAYLLQMCIAYCSLHESDEALDRLLGKIVGQIGAVVKDSPTPQMLLFWASNSLKLLASLGKDRRVFDVFSRTHRPGLEAIISTTLKGLSACSDGDLPVELQGQSWGTSEELRAIITDYYRSLDSNMSHASLNEVVARITAAMPSPQKRASGDSSSQADVSAGSPRGSTDGRPDIVVTQSQPPPRASVGSNGPQTPVAEPAKNSPVETPPSIPLTSTPILKLADADGNTFGDASVIPNESSTDALDEPGEAPPYEPLPEEWEELVDQNTKHRFFANHVTRQTSWTDPRDRLTTVALEKGDKGLGLGISGAKRTWDNRLVLGIFVSSLVPGSAAATEGSLKEGDEILEVNGHSLIGVSREGAIEFLKQVQFGQTVTLLVSQEPRAGGVKARHTAL